MQTNTWMPVPASEQRPGWLRVLGWYAAGWGVSVGSWTVISGFAWLMASPAMRMVGQLAALGVIVALVHYGKRLPRRSRIALWLGAATPIVLAAAAVAYLIYALAHSNFTF